MFAWSHCERKFGPLITERLAGRLSNADADTLTRHLKRCDRCRAREQGMRGLVGAIRGASDNGTLAHPAPAEFAELSAGGSALSPERKASIERHMESCRNCRAEWNVATSWNPARMPVSATTARPRRVAWGWFTTGALSTAAAAAALFAVMILPERTPGLDTRPALTAAGAPVQLRGAHHRAASDATPLPVSSTAIAVVISLTVEAAPPSLLEVELLDDGGHLLEKTEVTLEDPSGLVLLSVASSRLPDDAGEFRVRVAATGESFRYPFRVKRGGG